MTMHNNQEVKLEIRKKYQRFLRIKFQNIRKMKKKLEDDDIYMHFIPK